MKNICWLGWGIPMGLLFSVMFASLQKGMLSGIAGGFLLEFFQVRHMKSLPQPPFISLLIASLFYQKVKILVGIRIKR